MSRVVLVVFLGISRLTLAADAEQWQWVKSESIFHKDWLVSNGKAEVTINGRKFSAKLFWADSETNIKLTLTGSIVRGNVTVKETVLNSDVGVSTFTGRRVISKTRDARGAASLEIITLSDGYSMIGLTRTIQE